MQKEQQHRSNAKRFINYCLPDEKYTFLDLGILTRNVCLLHLMLNLILMSVFYGFVCVCVCMLN